MRSGFDLGVRQLPEEAVRAFGLLTLPGCAVFPARLAESLFGGRDAAAVLESLVDTNTVRRGWARDEFRYRTHDLVRCYEAEIAVPEPGRGGGKC